MGATRRQTGTSAETGLALPGGDVWRQVWTRDDFPVREGVRVHALVDGRSAMLAMCRAFLSARTSILLAAWDIHANLKMVRGEDAHVGPDGSDEQNMLLDSLRREGLSEDAIALWNSDRLEVRDVLGFAVSKGVKVGVLLWSPPNIGGHITNNPQEQAQKLADVGVDCLLDDSSVKLVHLTEALHQKCSVVDGQVAFLGGIDLTRQSNGDYDRWDTHFHPAESNDRGSKRTPSMHPWHDAHLRIDGPAVADVQRNIVQRWMDVAQRKDGPTWPGDLPDVAPPPVADGVIAQVVRSIPRDTYAFAKEGIFTIREAYMGAVAAAQRYIYLESQYLWAHVFRGIDSLLLGGKSEEMVAFLDALGDALKRGVSVVFVGPDHPNCGRKFTDAGVAHVRERAGDAADRFLALTLGVSSLGTDTPNSIYYRPVYVHAKVAIVDDQWFTVGSANLNNRGFGADAEINLSVLDPQMATDARVALWTEHLQAPLAEVEALRDVDRGLAALREQADANFARVRERQPLQGQALPYLTSEEGTRLGIDVDASHGWLDCMEGGAGETPAPYQNRYL